MGKSLWWRSAILMLCVLLGACQAGPALPAPTATPATFALLADALGAAAPRPQTETIGYMLLDTAGATLVAALEFDLNGAAHVPAQSAVVVWLGSAVPANIAARARATGALHYAAVRVRGSIEGPGAYGPSGQYPYQVTAPDLLPITPVETSIAELLDRPTAYQAQLLRVTGGLIVRDNAAILVESLGVGGLPTPKSRQLKLRGTVRDQALLARLKATTGGAVRFGAVQIEGILQNGALTPLAIRTIT